MWNQPHARPSDDRKVNIQDGKFMNGEIVHLSKVTPIDGGEIVVFCVAIAVVIIDVVMTVAVVKLRDFVVVVTGGDFMILGLTSGCLTFVSIVTFGI